LLAKDPAGLRERVDDRGTFTPQQVLLAGVPGPAAPSKKPIFTPAHATPTHGLCRT
jgi:hypothetical protein